MDSYLCPACGGTANEEIGCPRCGRPHDPDAAALAMLTRALASLDTKKKTLTADQSALRGQIAHVSAQHDALSRKLRERIRVENAERLGAKGLLRGVRRRAGAQVPRGVTTDAGGQAPDGNPPAASPPAEPDAADTAAQQDRSPKERDALPEPSAESEAPLVSERESATRLSSLERRAARLVPPEPFTAGLPAPDERRTRLASPDKRATRLGAPPRATAGGGSAHEFSHPVARPRRGQRSLAGPAHAADPAGEVAETSTGSMQTLLLALGGFLLAGAAIVLNLLAFASVGAAARMALLVVVTAAGLALPVALAKRGLTATAETVAAVALLLVLLDGYVAWSLGLLASQSLAPTVYFGLVCLVTAAVSIAYHATSHLVAPRFATLIVLQPVAPLLGYEAVSSLTGWALTLTVVAAIDLGFAAAWWRLPAPRVGAASQNGVEADQVLRRFGWALFAIAFTAGVACAATSLGNADQLRPAGVAALALLAIAALGVAGGAVWRSSPVSDIAAGIAVLAIVFSVGRTGAIGFPGSTLPLIALAVAVAAAAVPLVPALMRRGAMLAGAACAGFAGLMLLVTAIPVIVAPLRAAIPAWHADLTKYQETVSQATGSDAWQLVASGVLLTISAASLLPAQVRLDGVVLGAALTMLIAPAATGMGWLLTPMITVVAAVAVTAMALNVTSERTAWICLLSAAVLGGYTALASMTRPAASALSLSVITVAGAAIASAPRAARPDPVAERLAQRVTDAAGGAALFALPGAAAAFAATLTEDVEAELRTPIVLVASFIALAISVGAASLAQLARGRQSKPSLIGATLATIAVLAMTLAVPGTTPLDFGVGVLIATGTALLWLSPSIDATRPMPTWFRGADAATAALTVATIGAVMRATALVSADLGLLTVAVLVLITAVGAQAAPTAWRRGPVIGGSVVGFMTAAYAGGFAIAGAVNVVRAAGPIWRAPLGDAWTRTARSFEYGWQIPVALVLLAIAAAIALPSRHRDLAAVTAFSLAAAATPVGFSLGWASTMAIGWAAASGLAIAAAVAATGRSAMARLAAAALLATHATAASLVRPGVTATTLIGLTLSCLLVAVLGAGLITIRYGESSWTHPGQPWPSSGPLGADAGRIRLLTVVGGLCAAAALVTFPAAIAAVTAANGGAVESRITAALAAASVSLAVAGIACRGAERYLPYVSGGLGITGVCIVLASIPTTLPTSGYAAAVALLAVLAELLRSGATRPAGEPDESNGLAGLGRPAGSGLAAFRAARISGFGSGVVLAAGIPAAIAVLTVAPAIVAALASPYRWITNAWSGPGSHAGGLDWSGRWTGDGADVLAALVLTIAGALVAVGLDGGRKIISNRAVTVIIPGVAVTFLIAPEALRLPYPAQPTAALFVAAVAGLSIALSPPPPTVPQAASLWIGRRFAFLIAALSAGAGLAGSLATRSQTIAALSCSILVGLVGATRGTTTLSRVIGWLVAAGAAELLALAGGLAAGLPLALCAYPILMVAGLLLGCAGLLPQLNRPGVAEMETAVVEWTGYVSALVAVALSVKSPASTSAACFALGAILGIAAARPRRRDQERTVLIAGSALSAVVAIWLVLASIDMTLPEAYTLPFAAVALLVGGINLRRRPENGSWIAYGPALVAGFAPTLVLVLSSDSTAIRRVALIAAAVLTVAIGAVRRQRSPVVIGAAVTAISVLHELVLLGRLLPWPVLLPLFTVAGALLVGLGATYEKRRQNVRRLRGAFGKMR